MQDIIMLPVAALILMLGAALGLVGILGGTVLMMAALFGRLMVDEPWASYVCASYWASVFTYIVYQATTQ